MKKRTLTKSAVWKWIALFAVVFALSLPVSGQLCKAESNVYRVNVSEGYLALRTEKQYNAANEIGQLYKGDTVEVMNASDSLYWYVYAPKTGQYGYVNKEYLEKESTPSWTVKVEKGYLALRSAKAYDSSNEIGQLHTGDTVSVSSTDDSSYWYVYAPSLGMYGYVNKDYLYRDSGESVTVSVSRGYLALRTEKCFDSSNEIGELYTGDTVQILENSDSIYWYVYSPKYDKKGYVDKNYLYGGSLGETTYSVMTVSVSKGYLALRSEKKYDSSNETGKLYTGDNVQVRDSSDSTYWYVYTPQLGKYGYVNKDYLY